jgi:hypothetical protein
VEAVIVFLAFITDSVLCLLEFAGHLAIWWWHPSDADSPTAKPLAKKKG